MEIKIDSIYAENKTTSIGCDSIEDALNQCKINKLHTIRVEILLPNGNYLTLKAKV